MTNEELGPLITLRPSRTWLTILADYAVVIGLAGLAAVLSHPVIAAAAVVLIARQQHALAVLIHEGVHYRLFRSKRLNDFVSRWVLAGPLFLSHDGYRRTHLGHHRHTMTADDPDFRFVQHFPMSRARFVASFVPDVVGITYAFLIAHYARQAGAGAGAGRLVAQILPAVSVNSGILGLLAATGHASIYLTCWLLPMLFVLPVLLHLRGICEHGGHSPHPDPMRCTWTVINGLQTFLIAPHHINYHVEHHGYPAVPHFNLPRLHVLLKQQGALPLENVRTSYSGILARLVTPP